MTGVWLTDNPPCPRCGLTLHVDDPAEGYQEVPSGPMKLRHVHSTVTDRDGCVVALGRAVLTLNERLADLERQTR